MSDAQRLYADCLDVLREGEAGAQKFRVVLGRGLLLEETKMNPVISSLVNVGRSRKERLLPNGFPRRVRIYDNGGTEKKGGSIDRYTAVFTGRYRHMTGGEFTYLAMNGSPFYPQGFCQHCSSKEQIDRPRSGHLGRRIRFVDLPADCQIVVLGDSMELWDLGSSPYNPNGMNSCQAEARKMVTERVRAAESVPC